MTLPYLPNGTPRRKALPSAGVLYNFELDEVNSRWNTA